ncbi:MAG: hypothetical protein CG439_1537 [Methylococcaceae bacterium NSP1-2]|nr:DUF3142 domain-containing protein [Methylococcaceae bacterium]OYV17811.1 MAG: hypothetical protein CG439_1537 [Methylococcaceae bacterium NSP1-2]
MTKKMPNYTPILTATALAISLLSCQPSTATDSKLKDFPHKILWAWERPEDLRFLNSEQFAVAFLAQTLTLTDSEVSSSPRQQPLKVSPQTKLIAVTRIETDKSPALSQTQLDEITRLVLNTLKLKNVAALQIDFDAKVSQREFYRQLLTQLRTKIPATMPLSITALASFCLSDPWIKDLPIDEAIPMIFRMGADNNKVKNLLKNGIDFSIPLCQQSYGIATDEPLTMNFDKTRRIYVFKGTAAGWTSGDVDKLVD